MLRNKLVRSDGSIIDSSVIISCEFTEEVNNSENLSVGDVTSSEINLEIRSTDMVEQNEVLTYYIIEDGVETKIGVFNAEKPTIASRTSVKFSAYDNIAKTEKIFSNWLRDNQSLFPMTLAALVTKACEYCGVTLATTAFPQSDIEVNAFYADDLTCRQILAWAGAIAGRFVRANRDGKVEFAWYEATASVNVSPGGNEAVPLSVTDDGEGNISITSPDASVTDDGEGNVQLDIPKVKVLYSNGTVSLVADGSIPYKQGGLTYETYATDLIERVQIKQSDDDVGVIYPPAATGNCFVIRGNMLLGTCSTEVITAVAASLFTQLCDISYVPAKVALQKTIAVRAGDIVRILDTRGEEFTTYIMKMSVTPSGTSLESTGNKSYDTNAAVASEKYKNLTGKVLEITKDVEGLKIKAEDLDGRVAGISVDTEAIGAQVKGLDGKVAGLEITSDSLRSYVDGNFVTGETFGKYQSEVEQTALSVEDRFKAQDEYNNKISANIKTGLLDNVDGVPVYGLEIGQRTESNGVETFNKYARFTSDKLSFFDQGGNEVTSIGDQKMFVTHVEVTGNTATGDHGSFKQGGYMDVTQADGSVITKWVGG